MEQSTAVFENERGKITYRTNVTAGDEFSHTFVRMEAIRNADGLVSAERLAKWALQRFCLELAYKDGEEWKTLSPFVWEAVEALPRAIAGGGWLVEAAMTIYREVWMKSDAEVDGLKKA